MKIAYVCPYNFFRPGGVQNHIRSLANMLVSEGHEVTIIAPNMGNIEKGDLDKFSVRLVGSGRKLNFNKTEMETAYISRVEQRDVREWISQEHFDVIHFHTPWASLMPLQLLIWSSSSARVATFHDTPPNTFSGWLTRKVFKVASFLLYGYLDKVIAVSPAPAAHLYKSRKKPVQLVPPCVRLPVVVGTPRAQAPPKDLEVCDIFYVGRLEPRKGVADLIRAFHILNQNGVSAKLTIAGDGDQAPLLKELAGDLLDQSIVFLGSISDEQKDKWFSRSDIFCAPALYGESFGIVLVEAMNAGVPVLGGNNQGYRTVLKAKSDTCLFTPGNSVELADKLTKLVSAPNLRRELSEWGQREAQKYDCLNWLETICEHYKDAIAANKSGC